MVRFGSVSWSGPDVALVAGGARGPVSCRSISVAVSPPSVDYALSSFPGRPDYWKEEFDIDQFDDALVRFYCYPGNGKQLLPPHTPLYNIYVGGKPNEGLDNLTYEHIRLRNIRVGKPAVIEGLHVGGVSRFMTRTSAQNLGGRKTNARHSVVRVKDCHHEGRDYFARGCKLNPPLPSYCRIVYIDTCKLHWCSIVRFVFHSFAWPQNVGKPRALYVRCSLIIVIGLLC